MTLPIGRYDRPVSVLLIEDDAWVVEVGEARLGAEGFDVEAVGLGGEGLPRFDEVPARTRAGMTRERREGDAHRGLCCQSRQHQG